MIHQIPQVQQLAQMRPPILTFIREERKDQNSPKGYLHRPKETTQRSSKLAESGQEVMRLLKRPKLPILNTKFQNPIQLLMPKKKKPITFKDPEDDDKVNVWDILSSQ
ncbi:hypothetical protein BASA61_009096 [Batrachochytrium salamandrivorans]|nr:hypothetical protein BASA61_009096 [Batrachochytrium salamandrivorans]